MEAYIIACKSIEAELKKALELAGKDYPAVFLKPGLDDKPEELKELLIEEIKKLPPDALVILGYGFSNGAIKDIPAGERTLVAPLAEDVLCMILGSQARRDELMKEATSYFISEGWLKGDNIFKMFQRSVDKYGREKAVKLHKNMMSAYKRFLLIDTGTYNLADYRGRLIELGDVFGLSVEETQGDLSWLTRLVSGPPWGADFKVAEPGGLLTIEAGSWDRP